MGAKIGAMSNPYDPVVRFQDVQPAMVAVSHKRKEVDADMESAHWGGTPSHEGTYTLRPDKRLRMHEPEVEPPAPPASQVCSPKLLDVIWVPSVCCCYSFAVSLWLSF